jgi:hypothetical protein
MQPAFLVSQRVLTEFTPRFGAILAGAPRQVAILP